MFNIDCPEIVEGFKSREGYRKPSLAVPSPETRQSVLCPARPILPAASAIEVLTIADLLVWPGRTPGEVTKPTRGKMPHSKPVRKLIEWRAVCCTTLTLACNLEPLSKACLDRPSMRSGALRTRILRACLELVYAMQAAAGIASMSPCACTCMLGTKGPGREGRGSSGLGPVGQLSHMRSGANLTVLLRLATSQPDRWPRRPASES